MDIYLSEMFDEKNKLNKTLNNTLHIEGTLRNETSILNPSIIIEGDYVGFYNYMYIPQFDRYYFITDIESIRNDLWRISATVDVLMSFKDSLLSCPIILSNTETTLIENYMSGEMWKTLVKTKTDVISFPSGLNTTGEYILITSGG